MIADGAGPDELVIGLDSSTQSTKAVAWTRTGDVASEGRAALAMTSPHPGWAEQDPEDWWRTACAALSAATRGLDLAQIRALAISNQRETSGYLDASGTPVRPGIVWLDERGRSELPRLSAGLGAATLHRITGKPFDLTPTLSRLAWLQRHEPEAMARTAHVLDVQGYLVRRLTGRTVTSWTSADPFGIFDITAKAWSAPILAELNLPAEKLASLQAPGSLAGLVTPEAAAATGLPPGLPVILAGGDGQCAGLGVNAMGAGAVYLNLGTALITGMWAPEPRISNYWRTMVSPTGEGYFLEGVQRAGAFLLNWLIDTFAGGRADPGVFARLDAEAARIPLGSEGVTVSPYLSGCMDPHWDPDARMAILGLAPHHGPAHVYRAALEALTLESARAIAAMRAEGLAPARIIAVGGGALNHLWTQMFADATGLPVTRGISPEASSLGAAISAAKGIGWYPDFATAAAAMTRTAETVTPDPAAASAWTTLSTRQARTYRRDLTG